MPPYKRYNTEEILEQANQVLNQPGDLNQSQTEKYFE